MYNNLPKRGITRYITFHHKSLLVPCYSPSLDIQTFFPTNSSAFLQDLHFLEASTQPKLTDLCNQVVYTMKVSSDVYIRQVNIAVYVWSVL